MLIRHVVCRFLESRGFQVESAVNGLEALEKLARFQPAVIITDLDMPKISGLELLEALKASPATASIPVLILAGQRTDSSPGLDLRAGVLIHKETDIEQQLERALSVLVEPERPR
jgi:CheY-like chemotaxis protein